MSIMFLFLNNGNTAMHEAAQNRSDYLQILYAGVEALWEKNSESVTEYTALLW